MTFETAKYPSYQTTDYHWLPAIPSHWEVRRCRFVFREVDQRSIDGRETHLSMTQMRGLIPSSDLETRRLKSASYAGGKLVRPGDLVLNRLKAHLGVFSSARQEGVISPDYSVFRSLIGRPVDYHEKLLKTPMYVAELRRSTRGIVEGFWRLYSDDFYQIPALLPPVEEQNQIVAYLRAQDAKIARFIRDKRRLIELLNEQKQMLIHRAVTRGLDPNVRLKPSGVAWLGDVPEHWEAMRIKHVAIFNPSRSESAQAKSDGDSVAFIPMECLSTEGELLNPQVRSIQDVWEGFTYFKRGDVVLAKITPCFENGKSGCLAELPTEIGFGTTEFLVMRPRGARVTGLFLARLISLKKFREIGAESMTGAAGQQRISTDFVKNFVIPIPPLDEQVEITSRLRDITAEQDRAILEIRSAIGLALEYRDRLISDVVTGQIDVRSWVPGPDDVTDEAIEVLDDEDDAAMDEQGVDDDDNGHE